MKSYNGMKLRTPWHSKSQNFVLRLSPKEQGKKGMSENIRTNEAEITVVPDGIEKAAQTNESQAMVIPDGTESKTALEKGTEHSIRAVGVTTGVSVALTTLMEVAETLILALVIFFMVRAVVQNFRVEGSSMEPNLHSGQYLLVNRVNYLSVELPPLGKLAPFLPMDGKQRLHPFGLPQRGDIIVFRFPADTSRDFIKRVIALPGETVEIRAGKVYINDVPLEEPYIIDSPSYSREAVKVPLRQYYVLGDNRDNSSDSHVWGPVPQEYIVGKAWISYWPLDRLGLVPNSAPAFAR